MSPGTRGQFRNSLRRGRSPCRELRRPAHPRRASTPWDFVPPPSPPGAHRIESVAFRRFLAHLSDSQDRGSCIHCLPVDLSSRCEPESLIADHRSSATGRWRTVIRRSGDRPDALLQSLESSCLEDAYDDTCAWVNKHVGEHARIEHLCDGEREGILGVVACERDRTSAPQVPLAYHLSRILQHRLKITPDRPAP